MPRLRPAPKEKEEQLTAESSIETTQEELQLTANSTTEVTVEEPSEQEEATLALQKQLDELKKSEEIQRQRADQFMREREDALKKAREREVQITKFQKEAQESQFDAISSALAAAKAEAEKAQQDIINAADIGDNKGQAEAYRRLARAEANISKLEDGKVEIEARQKEQPVQQTQQADDPLERTNLPDSAKSWLRNHPDYLTDPRKNTKLQALHWDVVDEGHQAFSPEYFQSIEEHLGLKVASANNQQQQRTSIVSAPVSREVPSGTGQRPSGKVTLTAAQKDAARIAGVPEAEYAKQFQKLQEMKANGTYGDRQ